MTKTSSPEMDDEGCMLCGASRADHAASSIRHEFSTDGSLKQKDPKTQAPLRAQPALTEGHVVSLQLRLIDRLTAKGIFDPEDLYFIFGGRPDELAIVRGDVDPHPKQPGPSE